MPPNPQRRVLWILAFLGALNAILAIGFVSYTELSALADSSAEIQRSYDVLQTLDDLDSALTDSEANQRGFLLTRDPSYLTQYDAAVARIRLVVSELRRQRANEPSTAIPMAELSRLADTRLDEVQRRVHDSADGDRTTLAHFAEGNGAELMTAFRRASGELDTAQHRLLGAHRTEEHEARIASEGVLVGTILLSLVLVGAATMISRRFDERRRQGEVLLTSERAARTEAERATRLKDEFVATLSHELRTPLNAIVGWASILRRDRRPSTVSQGVEVIERNAKAQAQMVEDLLDMSRILAGKLSIELKMIDPSVIVHAAVATVRPTADAKGIELHSEIDSPGTINGDAGRLQQIVWNLLSNAIKFTPRGGKVTVRVRESAGHADIEVSDTGQGIRPEFLPHVFDRFRQADASTTRRHGGLGLGLSIVKSLVEMHGGTVEAQSPGEGQGTTLTAHLPLSLAQPHSAALLFRGDRTLLSDGLTLNGLKILVVDDEPDARALARRVLEEHGADVVTVASTLEALAIIDGEGPPSLVISDIGMPDQDGYDLIRQIRAMPGNVGRIPAVALTALARAEDRHRALSAGYQIHVSKPVDPAELIAVVANMAERRGFFAIESRPS